METHCPECGAEWLDGQTCTENFHLMLFWELDHQLYEVHHLMVLSYYLQHPSLYSPDGLAYSRSLLVQFLEEGITPFEMRQQIGGQVDSGIRDFKITGTPDSQGRYAYPVHWTLTCQAVIQAGIENYYASIWAWASSVLEALRESGNLR